MKPIIKAPNSVLTTPAHKVIRFDKRLEHIIEDMKITLIATKNPKGVGLAAPQIGESLRLFITRPTTHDPIQVFINAQIVAYSDEPYDDEKHTSKLEGCLSIPHVWGNVKRAKDVTIRFQDENGETHEKQISGFPATIIQHETDHINGILFTQRVLEQKNSLYQATIDKNGKEALEEMKI